MGTRYMSKQRRCVGIVLPGVWCVKTALRALGRAGVCKPAGLRIYSYSCGSLEYISAGGKGAGRDTLQTLPNTVARTAARLAPAAQRAVHPHARLPSSLHCPIHPARRTVDGCLEGGLRLRALELEGGRHHTVFHGEGLGRQVHRGHLRGMGCRVGSATCAAAGKGWGRGAARTHARRAEHTTSARPDIGAQRRRSPARSP